MELEICGFQSRRGVAEWGATVKEKTFELALWPRFPKRIDECTTQNEIIATCVIATVKKRAAGRGRTSPICLHEDRARRPVYSVNCFVKP